jgi:hypothetical protein
VRDDIGISSDVAKGGTAQKGKRVHMNTVSDNLGVVATGPDFSKS